MEVTRHCLTCNKPVKGRADKKFCDDFCRNSYNNKLVSDSHSYVRQVNRVLIKNRKILEDLLGTEGMIKQPKSLFIEKGFRFRYHTHQYLNRKGDVYYFCYEYGYLPLEGESILIVKRKDNVSV
jgi:hypothetical protein